MPKKPLRPESEITRAILSYLRAAGVIAWKNWSGPMTPVRGLPDILGVLPGGRALCIEVKRPGGRLSEHQERFLAAARRQGALAFVARSLTDAIEALRGARRTRMVGRNPADEINALAIQTLCRALLRIGPSGNNIYDAATRMTVEDMDDAAEDIGEAVPDRTAWLARVRDTIADLLAQHG